jgi:protein-disulfide isomerase
MRNEWLYNGAVAVMLVCALAMTTVVVRREFFPSTGETAHPGTNFVEDWRTYAEHGQWIGPRSAPVTLVAFSDFECPACRMLATSVQRLRAIHPGEIAVVFRHFPLPSHPHAAVAAQASECAAIQGRFEQYHDVLFAQQDSLGKLPWSRFAIAAGVPDLAAFERCVRHQPPSPALSRDRAAGDQLDVTGTPTLLINGRKVRGAPPADVLERYVEEALRVARGNRGER